MANQHNNIYAIGFRRGSRVHYLAMRETNFARTRKTLRKMLKGNTRYKIGHVCRVIFDKKGAEKDMRVIYTAKTPGENWAKLQRTRARARSRK